MIWVDWVGSCALAYWAWAHPNWSGRQRLPWPILRCRIDSGGFWLAVPGCRLRLGGPERVHRSQPEDLYDRGHA